MMSLSYSPERSGGSEGIGVAVEFDYSDAAIDTDPLVS